MQKSIVFQTHPGIPSCHAAVLCETSQGDLLSAWYAGSAEGAPDSVILGGRLAVGTAEWQSPEIWVNVSGHAAGNPRLFWGPDGAVWLIAPVNYGHWCRGGTRLFLKRSYDNGHTWTDLETFLQRGGVLGKNKPMHLPPAIWLVPAEYEREWQVVFIRSADNGQRWSLVEPPGQKPCLHQPSLVRLGSGELLAYMRSWEGFVYQTRSRDQGLTWTPPEPTEILNNNSGIDLLRLRSGRLVLACNPVGLGKDGKATCAPETLPAGTYRRTRIEQAELDHYLESGGEEGNIRFPHWGPRTPLSLLVSEDEGKTWRKALDVESGDGEFSYPAVIQAVDGGIHLIYTWQRRQIRHASFDESELMAES